MKRRNFLTTLSSIFVAALSTVPNNLNRPWKNGTELYKSPRMAKLREAYNIAWVNRHNQNGQTRESNYGKMIQRWDEYDAAWTEEAKDFKVDMGKIDVGELA